MLRSFEPVRGIALAAICLACFGVGCNSNETPAPPAGGAMEPGKMEPSKKMEPAGAMEPGKMEPGKMEPAGKMNP